MTRVRIAVEPRSYEAVIENGLLSRAGTLLRDVFPDRKRCFVVTVPAVSRKWGRRLSGSLASAGWATKILTMPEGERYKSLATLEKLAEQLTRAGADRTAVVLAFGGGVVGDVAGFLASVYMRGVDVVQIPTTVVAQVDASIGGKTGVNLRAGKNLVGSFHQPRAVLVDPGLLQTLNDREFRSGLFESLKCGVIRDRALFEFMQRHAQKVLARDPKALQRIITDSVRVKAAVVSADEKESGLRRILNFGHTIGHALE